MRVAERRPKLLFIARTFPAPMDSGQKVRLHNLLVTCARDFHVTLVTRAPAQPEAQQALARLGIVVRFVDDVELPRNRLRDGLTRGLAAIHGGMARESRLRRAYDAVLQSLGVEQFSLIWIERGPWIAMSRDVASRTIFDFDDVKHRKRWRRIMAFGWSWKIPAMLGGVVFNWYREVVAGRRFRAVTVCSEEDCRYLRDRWKMRNVEIVPNGFDPGPSRPLRRAMETPPKLLFLGPFSYEPNADAIQYFVDEILPVLRQRWPTLRLHVLGRNAPDAVVERWRDVVVFHGFVERLGEHLAAGDIFVAPLRWGSGTKLKLLAAMSAKLPIVTTPCGIEGLRLEHELSALIATDAVALAQAIARLADDKALAIKLSEGAHAMFMHEFTWDAIQGGVSSLLRAHATRREMV